SFSITPLLLQSRSSVYVLPIKFDVTVVFQNVVTVTVVFSSDVFSSSTLKFPFAGRNVTPNPSVPQSQYLSLLPVLKLYSVEIKPLAFSIFFIGVPFAANHWMVFVHASS